MGPSVNTGVSELITTIQGNPGQFIFWCVSEGSAVGSQVYNEIRSATGVLADRNDDFLGGFTFGNPCRQAGHTFPGNTSDPGGHGIIGPALRMSGTEERWWDFASPGDPVTVTYDDPAGLAQTTLFGLIYLNWLGTDESLSTIANANPELILSAATWYQAYLDLFNWLQGFTLLYVIANNPSLVFDWFGWARAFVDAYWGVGVSNSPHQSYGLPSSAPITGDARSAMQISYDQINSLAPLGADSLPTPYGYTPSPNGWSSCSS